MKKWISITVLAVLTIAGLNAQQAYVKFEGIEGESIDKDHKGWCDLASFSQALHQPASSPSGVATRRRGDVVLEDIVCVKELDKASPKLAEAVCMGKVFPKVEIHLTKSSSDGGGVTYYAYELKNARVTSYQVSHNEGYEKPVEEIALNFSEIKVTYTAFDNQGKKVGNIEYNWNVTQGR